MKGSSFVNKFRVLRLVGCSSFFKVHCKKHVQVAIFCQFYYLNNIFAAQPLKPENSRSNLIMGCMGLAKIAFRMRVQNSIFITHLKGKI
jgi:hypothetical protein